jgi:maltooligosyltrehalose trehalohydrolase
MYTFRVWAPSARTMSVRIGTKSHPLEKTSGGWWQQALKEAVAGTEYQYEVDGGEALPDPRSAFQPEGVNGPSLIVDHSAYKWNDSGWQAPPLSSGVIYELHIGTFTQQGTFLSAIERLDYLVDLGITHVELLPVAEFSGSVGWGYDGVDPFAPHHLYGSPDELKQLVNACHERGLAVLLDVVYNHLGPVGNYLSRFGPYFTDAYHTPWGSAVNFDHEGSLEVRRYFIDNALMWLQDYHFDGLRLDAIHAFFDKSAVHFLEELSDAVDSLAAHLRRHFVLIAESDLNDPRVVTSREAGGFGIDAQWSDDFHHALHAVVTGEKNGYYEDFGSFAQLSKALRQAFVYDGVYSSHRKRIHGRLPCNLSGHHFLAYIQNHDQVGNRAMGERLNHLTTLERTKIAAALVLTSPFIPMLFQGEEYAASAPFQYFTHHEDKSLAESVSNGRRNEFAAFGWKPESIPDPQDPATLERSKLDWAEIENQPHADLHAWYKRLIELRQKFACLTDGRLHNVHVDFDDKASWFKMRRGRVEVVFSLSKDCQQAQSSLVSARIELASDPACRVSGDGVIELTPNSVAILAGIT